MLLDSRARGKRETLPKEEECGEYSAVEVLLGQSLCALLCEHFLFFSQPCQFYNPE